MRSLPFQRRLALQEKMREQQIDACLFFHYSDLAYLTSSHLGNFLFVPQNGATSLFARKALDTIKSYNTDLSVLPFRSYKDLYSELSLQLANKTLGIPLSRVDYATLNRFLTAFSLNPAQIIDIEPVLNNLAMVKDPREVRAMEQANEDIADILLNLDTRLVLGKSEAELASYLYMQLRKKGFIGDYFFRQNMPFSGVEVLTRESILSPSFADVTYSGQGFQKILIVGSGQNLIQEDTPFVIDIMQNTQGIHADVTRTFVVGTPSDLLISRYKDLLDIKETLISSCQVGTPLEGIYQKGLKRAEILGYKEHFMGLSPNQASFVGHGLGAWVDEYPPFAPKISLPLCEGMTFALEPKLYFNDFDSPGLESNYFQTAEGPKLLTPLSEDLFVL